MKNLGFIVGGVAAVALIGFLFFRKKQQPVVTDVSQETNKETKDVSKAGKSIPVGSVMTKDRRLIAPPMKSGGKKTLNLSNTIQLKNDRQDDTIFEKAMQQATTEKKMSGKQAVIDYAISIAKELGVKNVDAAYARWEQKQAEIRESVEKAIAEQEGATFAFNGLNF